MILKIARKISFLRPFRARLRIFSWVWFQNFIVSLHWNWSTFTKSENFSVWKPNLGRVRDRERKRTLFFSSHFLIQFTAWLYKSQNNLQWKPTADVTAQPYVQSSENSTSSRPCSHVFNTFTNSNIIAPIDNLSTTGLALCKSFFPSALLEFVWQQHATLILSLSISHSLLQSSTQPPLRNLKKKTWSPRMEVTRAA